MSPTTEQPAFAAAANGAAASEAAAAAAPAPVARKFSASVQDEDSTSLFEKQWDVYQRVLQGDYLEHKGLYGAAERFLRAHPLFSGDGSDGSGKRTLKVLDLGCGDADCAARLLASSGLAPRIAQYVGVDMSPAAMAVAARHVSAALAGDTAPSVTFRDHHQQLQLEAADQSQQQQQQQPAGGADRARIDLVHGDMLAYARQCAPQSYDLVLASFAAHHLSEPQKAELLRLVGGRALTKGGALLLVDIFYDEGDTRDSYMQRFRAEVDATYTLLTPEERAAVLEHVTGHDYPHTLPATIEYATKAAAEAAAGEAPFAKVEVLFERRFFKAVAMTK